MQSSGGHKSRGIGYQAAPDRHGVLESRGIVRKMKSRSIFGLTLASLVLAAGGAAAQENLDAGKTGAQLFAQNCALCHKSPRGLAKSGGLFGVESFLQEHYTSSSKTAAAIADYLKSVEPGAPPERKRGAKPKGDDAGKEKAGKKKRKPDEAKSGELKPDEAKPGNAKSRDVKTDADSDAKTDVKTGEKKVDQEKPPKAAKPKSSKSSKPKPSSTNESEPKPDAKTDDKPAKPASKPKSAKPKSAPPNEAKPADDAGKSN